MKVYTFEGLWQLDQILLVGVGGTGAALAHQLARLLWHRQQQGLTNPRLHLIDPDVVELKNVGRQAFLPLDIGQPKAEVTARRLSLLYGLPISWSNQAFTAEQPVPRGSLLVGCVDNHVARQQLVQAGEGVVYLDNGNSRTTGQCVLGTTANPEKLGQAVEQLERQPAPRQELYYPCYHLPNIGLVYPELLQPEPESVPAPDLSCAELVLREEQHLLINEAMAMVCCHYLYKLLYRQPVTTYLTQLDLHNLALESQPISPAHLRQYL